jgi:tRNA A-37 threonylcarbamoyl transferase component Bud32
MLHEEATLAAARPIRRNTRRGGFIVVHPQHRAWLRKAGVRHADDATALRGEIVCGHPDRHVVQVGIAGRKLFVKRELLVGFRTRFKNWAAGAGAVSRSEREADVLRRLETASLAAPQWIAYGRDTQGRAFLVTEAFAGTCLPAALPAIEDRAELAVRIGRSLAELHEAGFGTPELAAKHLLVNPETFELTLIDWASCRTDTKPTNWERAKWFGTLHATVPGMADRDRLRMLWAYRRVVRATRKGRRDDAPLPRFSEQVRAIRFAADYASKRSSVRQQLRNDTSQRLVWVEGEAVVAVPGIARAWPTPAGIEPFYREGDSSGVEWVTFPEGQRGIVHRFETFAPVGRALAFLRERPWRSPAALCARHLFHLARHGVPSPALYAFGQRASSRTTCESFVAFERMDDARPWNEYFLDPERTPWERRRTLQRCGEVMRQLHDAGCLWAEATEPLFQVVAGDPGKVFVASPAAIELHKTASHGDRRYDLWRFRQGLDRSEAGWFLRGYLGAGWAVRKNRRTLVAGVL